MARTRARRRPRLGPLIACAVALLCLLGGLLPMARATQRDGSQAFVRVVGSQLWLGERPFRFVGANASVIHGPLERAGHTRVLDAVAADGLKVVRVWALGEVAGPEQPYHPLYAFRIGEQGWQEPSFVHLDSVLVAARERSLRVIVVLANRWKDYGGIGAYLAWAGQHVQRDERGEPTRQALSAFLDCARCQSSYREHVARVVGRTNSLTNTPYRDDPTIMAYELINEASAVSAREADALLRWVRESARFVRSLDANHLISAGHIGYSTSRERTVWRDAQQLPEVDFADAHAYPLGDPRISNAAQLARAMDDPLALALVEIKKPLVFGEFGFERRGPPRAYVERLRWMQAFVDHAVRRNAAGALVWLYEPSENPRRRHSITPDPRDPSSRHVRRILAQAAAQLRALDAGTSGASWSAATRPPQFTQPQRLRASRAPHRAFATGTDGAQRLDIDPSEFSLMSFERVGRYDGGALASVWGAGEGFVEYQLVAPPGLPRALVVEARISSELPGFGDGLDERDGSDVEISLDGEVVAIVRARPDDGLGELVHAELQDVRTLRRIFKRSGRHVLRFRSLPSEYAGGLCIYGSPTGNAPLAPEAQRPMTTIRVSLLR